MFYTPENLAPDEDEVAILTILSARSGGQWIAVAGSLISGPSELKLLSWQEWSDKQPSRRLQDHGAARPDLGREFDEELFGQVRITRKAVSRDDWTQYVKQIGAGELKLGSEPIHLDLGDLSAVSRFGQGGLTDAHRVLSAVKRPVLGVVAKMDAPEITGTFGHWVQGGPSKPLEQMSREELSGRKVFSNWPSNLLGIEWHGGSELQPPNQFVIGKATTKVWIDRLFLDVEDNQLVIDIAWDENAVDPLSCSLLVRSERRGAPLLARLWKVSDLPGQGPAASPEDEEPRNLRWSERTLGVRLPRGARRSHDGVELLAPDGELADERPVVPRVESVEIQIGVVGEESASISSSVGDDRPMPSEEQLNQDIGVAQAIEQETRLAAAHRRLATADEMRDYLKWRFSCLDGELLIVDRYLLHGGLETAKRVFDFLEEFDRPIRGLVTHTPADAATELGNRPSLDFRKATKDVFHDRLWIVRDCGVAVGASANHFLAGPNQLSIPATTAVDLPYADTQAWRSNFETWWKKANTI